MPRAAAGCLPAGKIDINHRKWCQQPGARPGQDFFTPIDQGNELSLDGTPHSASAAQPCLNIILAAPAGDLSASAALHSLPALKGQFPPRRRECHHQGTGDLVGRVVMKWVA